MNKFYLIIPATLLGVFLFFYNAALKEMGIKEKTRQEEVARVKAEEERKKKDIEAKAEADAKKRQEDRDRDEREKIEKKRKNYEDIMNRLRDDVTANTTEADKLTKEANDLELQISNLRTQKEKMNRETFELAKRVEQAKISRRNAELEIQRMVEVVANKVAASSLTSTPPPPPAK